MLYPVPIQRLPSCAPLNEKILGSGRRSPAGGLHDVKRTPSKRTRPTLVPIHKKPSEVWVTTMGEPPNAPSCVLHAVCAYSKICLFGLTAETELVMKQNKSKRKVSDRRVNFSLAANPARFS